MARAYRGATRDSIDGRRMLAAVEAVQGPKGVGACAWPGCGDPWAQVDHVLARARGGGDEPENLQGLCGYHNAAKGDGTQRPRRSPPAAESSSSRAWFG
jgi:5-methylcytosine-specific restriction endonuclease McrA